MTENFHFLGWNSLRIGFGESLPDRTRWSQLALDWQPEGIRNCSYATQPERIGITAQSRSDNKHFLAVYDCDSCSTRFLLQVDYVLHNAFNRSGSQICYTIPSNERGKADLWLYSFDTADSRLALEAILAQDTIPSWLPSDGAVAYHSADGQIEILDLTTSQRDALTDGHSPVVSPDGALIAFRRADQIYTWDLGKRNASLLAAKLKSNLTNGLSWSPNGRFLSFGAVTGLIGKETTFFLMDASSRDLRTIDVDYLGGMTLIARNDLTEVAN